MRLDVMERDSFLVEETPQCPDLINGHRRQLFRRHLDFPTTKTYHYRQHYSQTDPGVSQRGNWHTVLTLNVWKPRVSSNLDIVLLAVPDGVLHYQRIAGMKPACNIGMIDER